MGSNAAIDVAVSLILMYLVLSLIVTVLNEAIATAADLRAANLQAALNGLIDDPELRKQFYDHGLIASANDAVKDRKGIIFQIINWLYRLAPFWFDLLSMFMRIRGTGDKPEKTSAT